MNVIAQHLIAVLSALPTDSSAFDSSISALKSSISVLEVSIKTLEDKSAFWETLLLPFSALVVIGVALEICTIFLDHREKLAEWGRGIIQPPDRPSTSKLLLGVGATLLVVIGVAGELGASGMIASINGQLRTKSSDLRSKSDQLLALVTQEAGDAATSAKIAHEEADAVAKQAAAQGPRAKLIAEAAPELAARLASFAGQRVGLFVCGRQGTPDQETLDTWGAIANILGPDVVSGTAGAKWKEIPTNLNFADGCGAARGLGQGVIVFVSKRASRRTMEAANALGHGLAKALPPSQNKMPSLIDPDFAKLTADRGFQDRNVPWVSVGLDPDLITVLIGAHP